MPRAVSADYLQNFRFHAKASVANEDVDPLVFNSDEGAPFSQAGFQSISVPELSADAVEYRDGLSLYPIKQQGPASVGDTTLQRGIALQDTAFFEWILDAIKGNEYRADLRILIFPNNEGPRRSEQAASPAESDAPFNEDGARQIKLYNALPTRVKPNADLDATSGDISIGELDLAVERMGIGGAVESEDADFIQ